MVRALSPQRPRLTVDLAALARNYATLRTHAGKAEVGAVVKADAYGLGAPTIAPALAARGCRQFFVVTEDEGDALVAPLGAFNSARLYVLGGVAQRPGLISVLNTPGDLEALRDIARKSGAIQPAAIHVDTGMNRLGFPPGELLELLGDPTAFDGISVTLLMSHLACADVPEAPENAIQLARFERVRARLPGVPASLANSAGALLGSAYHFDLVRPGVALYGGNPMAEGANLFCPTVTLEAPLLQVRFIDKGDSVGYAASYRAGGPARIATIAAGYADGYLRAASNRGSVVIGGHVAEIVGRVSMDLLTVDVSALPEGAAVPGAMAQLIGPHWTVDDVARAARTISYEVLTRIGGRVERHYRPDSQGEA